MVIAIASKRGFGINIETNIRIMKKNHPNMTLKTLSNMQNNILINIVALIYTIYLLNIKHIRKIIPKLQGLFL